MAEDSRPTKRSRSPLSPRHLVVIAPGELHDPTAGQETFTRHTDFWLEDGNLILLAGNTAFRVLRSLLAKNSAVFADMFVTGSPDATELFDDCLVVRLSDYPGIYRTFFNISCLARVSSECPSPPPSPSFPSLTTASYTSFPHAPRMRCGVPMAYFSELHATVHLAHKYQCPDVEAHALSALKRYYAPTFHTYNRYSSMASALLTPQGSAAIAVVNIARLTNTLSMLPFALYEICSTVPSRMVDGYGRRDGSLEHLSPQDLKMCIGARSELVWILAGLVSRVFTLVPGAGCKRAGRCTAARWKILVEAETNAWGRCDALESFHDSIEDWAGKFRLCKLCRKEMLARDVEERKTVWEKLPGLFGLTVSDVGCAFVNWDDSEESSLDSSDSD